ncbi:MAG: hypothetical protein AAB842_01345 [Patescibacteria group bacterium]
MKTKEKTTKSKLEQETLRIQLAINTTKTEKFIDELEKLCEKFSDNKNFFLKFQ